jgi:hypothetical protein
MSERRSVLRFNHDNRTPEYREAISALQLLNRDQAQRAIAEYSNAAILDDFEREHVECRGVCCVHRLKTGHHVPNCKCNPPPGADHCSLWKLKGEDYPTIFVMQPYHLDMRTVKKLVAYCEEYDFELYIESGNSWHFNGQSIAVLITRGAVE